MIVLLLGLMCDVLGCDYEVWVGVWEWVFGFCLFGWKFGIVGFGCIGWVVVLCVWGLGM